MIRAAMRILGAVLALVAFHTATPAGAQTWPTRPVKVVLPVPPGGAQDVFARGLAAELAAVWNQSVVVENKTGASSILATESVTRAAPDGYTILQMDSISTWVSLHLLKTKPPYDFDKDLVPVKVLMATSGIFVANPSLPANNLQELAALGRASPGQITTAASESAAFRTSTSRRGRRWPG